jgi:hypothetical protein
VKERLRTNAQTSLVIPNFRRARRARDLVRMSGGGAASDASELALPCRAREATTLGFDLGITAQAAWKSDALA